MPGTDLKKSSAGLAGVVVLLFVGIALALAGNVYQFRESRRLASDLAATQQKMGKQFAEMRELESGQLEQNLRRLDELSQQFDRTNAMTLQQARAEVRRSRAELSKALEQKDQEVTRQMLELQSDLQKEANARLNRVSADLAKTRTELQREVKEVSIRTGEQAKAAKEPIAEVQPPPPAPQPEAPAKSSFWSKLNPFKSHKAKTDVAAR